MGQQKYFGKAIAALLAIAAIPVLSLCVGKTQARNENYAQWRGVYTPQKVVLSSPQLTPQGQTVLLGDWLLAGSASRMQDISIRADAGAVEGTLQCVSDHPQYITPTLERTQVTVDTAGVQIPLTITPTAAALALTQPQSVSVRVTLQRPDAQAPELFADYRLNLLPAQAQAAEETQPTEETQETQPTEETLPQQTPPTPAALNIDGAASFAWTEQLALSITAPVQADTLTLQMDGGLFPEQTRYSVHGETYLLGDAMAIEIPVSGLQTCDLLLDLSLLTMPQSGEVNLQAQTLHKGEITAQGQWTAAANRQELTMDLTQLDPVLTGKTALSVPLGADTDGLVWKLEMLTKTHTGIEYTESDEQFYLVVTVTDGMLTVSNANGKAPAGTYRLTLERIQGNQTLSSRQLQFFICY